MTCKRSSLTILAAVVFLIAGCNATWQPHPALQISTLPALIPLHRLFINTKGSYQYKLSPDGKKLTWLTVRNGAPTLLYRDLASGKVKQLWSGTTHYQWARDSRRILFLGARDGTERTHIYTVDTALDLPNPIDLTPFEDETRSLIACLVESDPETVLITQNHRDKTVFDLYKINLVTLKQTLVCENPGDVHKWITDRNGVLRARMRYADDKMDYLELKDEGRDSWTELMSCPHAESVSFLSLTPDNKRMWFLSNRGRDRVGLVSLDIQSGRETLVYQDPEIDLAKAWISRVTDEPAMAFSFPDYPKVHFLDKTLEQELGQFLEPGPAGLRIVSTDDQERMLVLQVYTDQGYSYYLFNRDTGKKELLAEYPLKAYAQAMSTMQPISFQARDGMTLHGYLTVPRGTSGKGLPMVLLVHGGPWARDYWECDSMVQFLANRGYVVLQVNFRGSAGYGRAYMQAAGGEFAGRMQTDLLDGVDWAVEKGYADPNKIGIVGGSYGGYAVLVGMTFTPETFACGVDICGISNLVTFLQSVPKCWKLYMPQYYSYVGDPKKPEDLEKMRAKSPLFKADQVVRPLFIVHGANDPRVTIDQSETMVQALRKAGKDVQYMVLPNEGHGISRPGNTIRFYRRLEVFLAQHLGGRDAGFDPDHQLVD